MPDTEPPNQTLLLRLTRQLTAVEGSINDVATYANAVRHDSLPSSSELEARHKVLDQIWLQASNTLMSIEAESGPCARRQALMQHYINLKANLIHLIKLAETKEGVTGGFEATPVLEQTLLSNANKAAHLPRIDLPKFNGTPTEWLSFKGRFEKRVSSLTEDTEKYAFLQKCLERFEPALNACLAFENSGLSFPEAWKKLEERFYKKRIAFEGHFYNVLRQRKPQKQNSKSLLCLVDAVDTLLTSARQIAGESEGSMACVANGLLVCLVKDRIDEQTLNRLEDKLDLQKLYSWEEFKSELERIG